MTGMIGRLRSLWDAPPASPAPPKRVWRDWVLIALLPLLAVFEGLVRTDVPNVVAAVLILIAVIPTLLWRRTHRAWMIRGYAIGMGAGTQFLVFVTVGLIAGEPDVTTTIILMGAAWVVNLVVAEIAIRRSVA